MRDDAEIDRQSWRRARTFAAFRDLKRAVGETIALVEVDELARRAFQDRAADADVALFVDSEALRYGLHVKMKSIERVPVAAARASIVVVYAEAEAFFDAFAGELREFGAAADYLGRGHETRLNCLLRLAREQRHTVLDASLQAIVSAFGYYEHVRHMTVHPSARAHAVDRFAALSADLNVLMRRYGSCPQSWESLAFHDVILFTRIVVDVAAELCVLWSPTDDEILAALAIPMRRIVRSNSYRSPRARTSLVRMIETRYAVERGRAEWIAGRAIEAYELGG